MGGAFAHHINHGAARRRHDGDQPAANRRKRGRLQDSFAAWAEGERGAGPAGDGTRAGPQQEIGSAADAADHPCAESTRRRRGQLGRARRVIAVQKRSVSSRWGVLGTIAAAKRLAASPDTRSARPPKRGCRPGRREFSNQAFWAGTSPARAVPAERLVAAPPRDIIVLAVGTFDARPAAVVARVALIVVVLSLRAAIHASAPVLVADVPIRVVVLACGAVAPAFHAAPDQSACHSPCRSADRRPGAGISALVADDGPQAGAESAAGYRASLGRPKAVPGRTCGEDGQCEKNDCNERDLFHARHFRPVRFRWK